MIDTSRDMHTHPFEKGKTKEHMEKFVLEALHKGLRSIAFTDHAPMAERCSAQHVMSMREMDSYVRWAEELRLSYARDITIRIGIEADYHPWNNEMVSYLKDQYQPEILIGSLHLHTEPWDDWIRDMDCSRLAGFAFQQTEDLISTGLYDVLGHFDMFRMLPEQQGCCYQPELWRDSYERVFSLLAARGMVLECNYSGLRKKTADTFPAALSLEWSIPYGISLSAASDAHWPQDVGGF